MAAGTVAIRIAQMTGWVSFTLMGLYANVGEIENGMNTLAKRERVEDQTGAVESNMRLEVATSNGSSSPALM